MFEMLLEKMSQVQSKLSNIEVEVNELQNNNVVTKQSVRRIKSTSKELNVQLNSMGETMTDLVHVVSKSEQEIMATRDKLNHVEQKVMKGSFIIRGIVQEEGEDLIDKVENFFTDQLELDTAPAIQFAYRFGRVMHKSVMVKLVDPSDARHIFANVQKLKGKTNGQQHY